MRFHGGCRLVVFLPAFACFLAVVPVQAGDVGRPRVKPFPDAKVLKRSVKDLEAYWIPLGKLFGDGQAEKYQVVEGKWTHVTYSNPPKRSVIEIGRGYDQQLRDAGFEIVYDCRDGNCGQGGRKTNGDWWDPNFQRRYLVGRLERAEGDLWACIHVEAKGPNVAGRHDIDLIEAKPEPREAAVVRDETDAGWIEGQLTENGHVALYGIGFDARRSMVLPTSEPTVRAVAQLFARDPRRRLLVVVHTGDLADWKSGVQGSRRQAAALVSLLVKKYGIAAARVAGDGVGPLAPMSPGRDAPKGAGTRRVEIVMLDPAGSTSRVSGRTE